MPVELKTLSARSVVATMPRKDWRDAASVPVDVQALLHANCVPTHVARTYNNREAGVSGQTQDEHYLCVSKLRHGTRILAGTSVGAVRCWDADTGDSLALACAHAADRGSVTGVAAMPSDEQWVSGGGKHVALWDLETWTQQQLFTGHQQMVWAVSAMGPTLLASAARDRSVRIWDTRSGKSVREMWHPRGLRCISGPIGSDSASLSFASSSEDGRIRLWSLGNAAAPMATWKPAAGGVATSLALFDDDCHLACGLSNGRIEMTRLADQTVTTTLAPAAPTVGRPVTSFVPSGDRQHAVSAGFSGVLRIWDCIHGTEVTSDDLTVEEDILHQHAGPVYDMVASGRDDGGVITAGYDNSVRRWAP